MGPDANPQASRRTDAEADAPELELASYTESVLRRPSEKQRALPEVYEWIGNKEREKHHRELSRATILKLADSLLPEEAALRKKFLAAPAVSKILAAD